MIVTAEPLLNSPEVWLLNNDLLPVLNEKALVEVTATVFGISGEVVFKTDLSFADFTSSGFLPLSPNKPIELGLTVSVGVGAMANGLLEKISRATG